jgi:hypothetical protein
MRANWEAMFAGVPDFHAEICRSVLDGDTTWTEWRWSGSRSDGQAFEMRGVTLFEITDDQIAAGWLYLDEVERDVVGIEQAVESLSGRRPRPASQSESGAPLTSSRLSGRAPELLPLTCRDE